MNIYHYDAVTKELVGQGLADKDPLVEGNYLIPANATEINPPEYSEGFIAIFSGDVWSVEIDQRGTNYWLVDGTKKTIEIIGETIPDDAYLSEYEIPERPKTPEQLIAEQQHYLNQTDWIVVKINESMILGDDIKPLLEQYSDELSKRAEARELINSLGA